MMDTSDLIDGYPLYDTKEACTVYKFKLDGYKESDIHMNITSENVLKIAAYRQQLLEFVSFEREILLEPEVDAKLIPEKKVFQDGILTVKIPKEKRPDGLGQGFLFLLQKKSYIIRNKF